MKKSAEMPQNSLKKPASEILFCLVLTLIAAAGCSQTAPLAGSGDPWGAYLHDAARTNSTSSGLSLPLKVSWSRDLGVFSLIDIFPEKEPSSAAIYGTRLFVSSTGGKVYAFDLASGRLLWKSGLGLPTESSPAAGATAVCSGSSNGLFRCLDARTGSELWRHQAKSEITSSPVIEDNAVFFYSSDDRVTALELKTGDKLWSYSMPAFHSMSARTESSPALWGRKLYQVFSDNTLVCIDLSSGRELWSKKAAVESAGSGKTRTTPLVLDSKVYVIDKSGAVAAFDAETGKDLGLYNVIKADDFVISGGKNLIIAGREQAAAVDMNTGSILWSRELKRGRTSSVFAAGDAFFILTNFTYKPLGINLFTSERGYIEAVSASDGKTLWGMMLPSSVSANGSTAYGRAAVMTDSGRLIVLAPEGMP